MALRLGSTTINAMRLGASPVSAAYLGGVQIFGGAAPAPDPIAPLFANGEAGDEWLFERDFCYTLSGGGVYERVTTTGDEIARVTGRHNGINADQNTFAARPIYNEGGGLSWGFFETDDWMVTPTITPGTNKAQIFAGLLKSSDAAAGIVLELSVNINNNLGAFYLAAPESTSILYSSGSRGATTYTSASLATITASGAAPDTAVITATHDIAANLSTIRRNGVGGNNATGSKGGGNFGNYPLYIGARAGTSIRFNGRIYSAITRFGPNLDLSTIQGVEGYMAGKTGVTL